MRIGKASLYKLSLALRSILPNRRGGPDDDDVIETLRVSCACRYASLVDRQALTATVELGHCEN